MVDGYRSDDECHCMMQEVAAQGGPAIYVFCARVCVHDHCSVVTSARRCREARAWRLASHASRLSITMLGASFCLGAGVHQPPLDPDLLGVPVVAVEQPLGHALVPASPTTFVA